MSWLLLATLATGTAQASYNVMERYKLLEDKLKTEDMLRPFGHDFLIDVNVAANKNVLDFKDDISKMSKVTGTDTQKVDQAITILDKWVNTEQTLKGNLNLGIPLFSFNAWGIKFTPDLRVSVLVGANLAIQSERLTVDTISSLLGQDVPDVIKTAINTNAVYTNLTKGSDVVQVLIDHGSLTAAEKTVAEQYKGKYFWPGDISPIVSAYAKLDGKGGLLVNMEKKKDEDNKWFGYVNMYGLARTDYLVKLNAATFVNDKGVTDQVKNANTQVHLMTDLKLGYEWYNYTLAGTLEEIKISTLSDNKEKGGDLKYKTPMLVRLHGDAEYKYSILTLTPFLGMHKRTGYDFMDGVYGGADVGAHVWGKRLGLQFRTMLDNNYITLSPRLKLWLMQLEYSLKKPITEKVDGMKVSTLHSLDFRLFF